MLKQKKIQKYVFYGGAFGAALVAVALAGMSSPQSSLAAFFSQWTADTQASTEITMYQQLSCADITYDIASVDMVLSGGSFTSPQGITLSFGTLSGTGAWDKLKKRTIGTSAMVSFKDSDTTVVTFTFSPPVAKSTLCKSPDAMVHMTLERTLTSAPHPFVHGSRDANAYRSALYGCVLENGSQCLGDLKDMAFQFATTPNTPPTIENREAVTVNELDTLTFTLVATDSDGDSIRWGSSNLPDGATLNETTGEFSWTPTEDQIKEYKVTFIATDDGGPVEESDSMTMTIIVVDVVTPPNMNQTLLENVLSYELEKNIENSYIAHLKNLDTFISEGQITAAINQLTALRGRVIQDGEKGSITETVVAELLKEIDDLLATLRS